jgi:hypothetical protein
MISGFCRRKLSVQGHVHVITNMKEAKTSLGKLPRMGKPPYMKPHHVLNNDLLVIVDEPYVKGAEESVFGKDRGYMVVRVVRTGDTYTWGLNGTTWDRLIDAFGDDSKLWTGKKVKVRFETRMIRGEPKQIIYGAAYKEPQKLRCVRNPAALAII